MLQFKIIDYQEVSSTNEVLKEFSAREGAGEGTVILADFQTAGRGRADHTWFAEPGKNILMSLLLKPMLEAADHFLLNEFISLVIVDVLRDYGLKARIKWPNDIFLEGGKLAGLLIENSLSGSRITRSIVGLGLNLNSTNFPKEIPNPVSIKQFTGKSVSRKEFMKRLEVCARQRYAQFREQQVKELHLEYLQHILGLGEEIRYQVSGEIKEGILENIRPQGDLVIRTKEGVKAYLFGEVSLLVCDQS